tara:strand:- start:1125 stop:2051 length:927 start_codon:yes stop_codon:yes gene_type:complete
MNKKFIVTGGCGFIGSHLVEKLISNGFKVIVIDDLSTGKLSNLKKNKNLKIYISKIEDFKFDQIKNVDGVFHLGAQVSVPLSIENFFESSKTNMLSSFKVISFCEKNKVPIVYASSSAIYGNLPFGDEQGKIELLSPYAADKYSMEKYLEAANKYSKLSSFGLRFFNVYGPRQDPSSQYSGVISIFSNRLNDDKKIFINGGYQTRDFVYVEDVVKCLIKAYKKISKSGCFVCNVLTGESITIDDLVKKLSVILNIKPKCIYRKLPLGDPERSAGNVMLMEKLLQINVDNFIKINDGLKKTIKWEKMKK